MNEGIISLIVSCFKLRLNMKDAGVEGQAFMTPDEVITMLLSGRPHRALAWAALLSLSRPASALKAATLSLELAGPNRFTCRISLMVSKPSMTRPNTMFSPSRLVAGPGPAVISRLSTGYLWLSAGIDAGKLH